MAYQAYAGGSSGGPGRTPSMASQHHQPYPQQQQTQYQPAQGVSRMASNASSYYGAPNSSARPAQAQHAPQGGPSSGRQPSAVRRVIPPCPVGVSESHWKWFHTVDVDASGQISPLELQQALINGDHSKFESETIKMLFGLFDTDKSGSIGFTEFVSVFKYVEQWQSIFRTFDADRSGTIEAPELATALQQFQYNLSPRLIDLLCKKFSPLPSGPSMSEPGITFDRFVRCCVSIKTLTDAFMAVDTDRDGYATVSYDQFLDMVLSAP